MDPFFICLIAGFAVIALVCALTLGVSTWRSTIHNSHGKRILPSKPARHIMTEFKALPAENRPYPSANLEHALAALDVKVDKDRASAHFTQIDYDSSYFKWSACNSHHCEFKPYKDLHNAIAEIQTNLDAQKHALEMAGVAHHLDRVSELTEALRAEAGIVREVTKDLTS